MASDSNDLAIGSSIDLAREESFSIGSLIVHPRLRQIIRRSDGAEELVEPRVMQVLVALARADGEIVTRDDLVRDCWDGRFVGDDAINRALSRVRKLSEGIGQGAFTLDTVIKVGYRLVVAGKERLPAPPAETEPARPASSRRILIAGSLAAAATLTIGGWALLRGSGKPRLAPGTEAMMDQAAVALSQATHEGQNQAIGLYRRVVDANPDFADGWGALGNAYAVAARYRIASEREAMRLRARAAARRALALDSRNGYAQVAVANAWPIRGRWYTVQQATQSAIAQNPKNQQLLFGLAADLMNVGRFTDVEPIFDRIVALGPPPPEILYFHITLLWDLDRLEEADRLMEQAATLYPTHFGVWFTRFYILMYSGRANAAIAMADDRQSRPSGIRDSDVDMVVQLARAIATGNPALVAAQTADQLARAHQGSGYAENAIQFAASVGHIDEAFAIADAYYFGRGFEVPEVRFAPEQGTYTGLGDRATATLFKPSTRAMRKDPRFARLIEEIGLDRYWQESRNLPDYRRAAQA